MNYFINDETRPAGTSNWFSPSGTLLRKSNAMAMNCERSPPQGQSGAFCIGHARLHFVFFRAGDVDVMVESRDDDGEAIDKGCVVAGDDGARVDAVSLVLPSIADWVLGTDLPDLVVVHGRSIHGAFNRSMSSCRATKSLFLSEKVMSLASAVSEMVFVILGPFFAVRLNARRLKSGSGKAMKRIARDLCKAGYTEASLLEG